MVSTIVMERKWPLILQSEYEKPLAQFNSVQRRVDLLCKIVMPLGIGLLTDWLTVPYSALVFGIYVGVECAVEVVVVLRMCRLFPLLVVGHETTPTHLPWSLNRIRTWLSVYGKTWRTFLTHRVFLSSLAMATLYASVLSFGGPMITYLYWLGYSSVAVAGMRSGTAVFGISATWLSVYVLTRIGLDRTGLWSIWGMTFSVSLVVTSLYMSSTLFLVLFLIGLSISRLWLWVFDLATLQIMQERIEEEHSGALTGCHYTLLEVFGLVQYAVVAIFSDPSAFLIPSWISFGFVCGGALIFTQYVYNERGHLLHWRWFKKD
jgi:iron-regulated transporter 1